jgi:hypothetical protein
MEGSDHCLLKDIVPALNGYFDEYNPEYMSGVLLIPLPQFVQSAVTATRFGNITIFKPFNLLLFLFFVGSIPGCVCEFLCGLPIQMPCVNLF